MVNRMTKQDKARPQGETDAIDQSINLSRSSKGIQNKPGRFPFTQSLDDYILRRYYLSSTNIIILHTPISNV